MSKVHTTNVQDLQSFRDGTAIDLASFQRKLQDEMKQTLTTIMKENMVKLEEQIDATIIEYDARLTVKTEDIKQDAKTATILGLQQEQRKLKKLSDEMTKTKDMLLIDITAGINTLIISEVEDLRQEIINK